MRRLSTESDMPFTKFAILSTARSGTSHLSSMLKKTPGAYVHGEIFGNKPKMHIRDEYSAAHDVTLKDREPIAFVESILAYAPPGKTHVGFKMWRSQSPEACAHVLADTLVRKIILERENRLGGFSSAVKAKQTGIWNRDVGRTIRETYTDTKIDGFKPAVFKRFVAGKDEIFRYYTQASRGPTLRVTYHEIISDTAYETCLDFLGLPAPGEQPPGKRQLNSSDLLSRYREEDRPAIVATLDELGHPEWTIEA